MRKMKLNKSVDMRFCFCYNIIMKNFAKSIISFLLALCLLFGVSMPASAQEGVYGGENQISPQNIADSTIPDTADIKSLKFEFSVINLGLGETLAVRLKNQDNEVVSDNITYSSSDKSIASVSKDGRITGKKLGKAVKVTAVCENGVRAVCTVNVNNPCKYLSLSVNRAEINAASKQINIDYQVHGGSARGIKWVSSDTSVATVDENGIVSGIKVGECVITASTFNGKTAYCTITVSDGELFVEKKATSLKFDISVLNLGLGEKYPTVVKNQDNVKATQLTFKSSDSSVATVAADGSVSAKKLGKATITATTNTGVKATCTVNVKNPCNSISLNIVKANINIGAKRININYQVHGGAARGIKWESSDTSVATVDENGIVTGIGNGECVITASTYHGKSAECKITVSGEKENTQYNYSSLKFLFSTVNLGLGENLPLIVKDQDGKTVTERLTFTSSNGGVAQVSSKGVVSGKKLGKSVKVTVRSDNGKTAECVVNVNNPCNSISLNIVKANINVGAKRINIDYQVHGGSARGIKWVSSDTSVATVDENGIVTGIGNGECVITASTFNGKTAKCSITVQDGRESVEYNVTSLKFDMPTVNLGLGETLPLVVRNQNNKIITDRLSFSTSSSSRVSVSSDGKITGKKLCSNVKITVRSDNGKTATCTVNVKNPCTSVSLNYSNETIGVGERTLNINYQVHGGAARGIKWTSSDSSIAATDQNGIITGIKPGTVTITATTFNNKRATAKITVKKAPTALTVTNKNKKVQLGTENLYRLDCRTKSDEASNKLTYSSSNSSIASVNSSGYVTAHKTGTVMLTATAYNGVKVSCNVNVVNENNCFNLNRNATQISYDYDNVSKYVFGKSTQGRNLEAFIITPSNGKFTQTYVMSFAIHGFEDNYARDGQLLTQEGNRLVEYYAKNPDKLKNFRLVIVPCLNPDGTAAGKNNYRETSSSAFGRCTAAHIDMNRDFPRFKAVESRAFRDLLKKYNPDLFTDFHGWLNKTIGTSKMVQVFNKNLKLTYSNSNEFYYSYLYAYVNSTYKCPSALVEYRSPSTLNHTQTYNAINELIRTYNK